MLYDITSELLHFFARNVYNDAIIVRGTNIHGKCSWIEVAKLTASDGAASDAFGVSVGISGDFVIVGARSNDNCGLRFGTAYIFERNGDTWTEITRLRASDPDINDQFGGSVAISGDLIIVAARLNTDRNGAHFGSAYIFERSQSVWSEVMKLIAGDPDQSNRFGLSVDISANLAGTAYVYELQPIPELPHEYVLLADKRITVDRQLSGRNSFQSRYSLQKGQVKCSYRKHNCCKRHYY